MTKTCGECKCYDMHGGCNKLKNTLWIHSTNIACIKFEAKNPTNGDLIRQGGNKRLITFSAEWSCFHCAYRNEIERKCKRPKGKDCFDGIEAWLDAPADDCVTQNGNNDTQADLCITDDTQDQEVKHE